MIILNTNEKTFLQLLCHGLRPRAIAEQMGKSERTLDGYRDSLFAKTGANSQTGLVIWSFNNGLIKPSDKEPFRVIAARKTKHSFKDHIDALSKTNKRYYNALETIIRALQIVKNDSICADIIKIAEKALNGKSNAKSNNRKVRPGRRGRKTA
jgi:DNA-binding CsgD family transcriptional regulator